VGDNVEVPLFKISFKSNGGGAPHSKQWGMQGAAAG